MHVVDVGKFPSNLSKAYAVIILSGLIDQRPLATKMWMFCAENASLTLQILRSPYG